MESPFEKFVIAIAKVFAFILIAVIVILSVVHIEGPGVDAWFAKHPVIHVVYSILSFFGRLANFAR